MNWPKLVVEYGQIVAWIAIALSVIAILAAVRGSRYFLPRGVFGWITSLAAAAVIYYSGWLSPLGGSKGQSPQVRLPSRRPGSAGLLIPIACG